MRSDSRRTLMNPLLALLFLLLVSACSTKPTRPIEGGDKLRARIEVAIARQIHSDVKRELPLLKGSSRAKYLEQKTDQLRRSVDYKFLSSSAMLEFRLLEYLSAMESLRWQPMNYETRVRMESSTNLSLEDLEYALLANLAEIDNRLSALPDHKEADKLQHLHKKKETNDYPDDSFAGRQAYLDSLQQAMQLTFEHWPTIEHEARKTIELIGRDGEIPPFQYNDGALVINLKDVTGLPFFELESIAAYYGYPGRAATDKPGSKSLKTLMVLPGYQFGWAWYNMDRLIEANVDRAGTYLHFINLMSSLALADLKLHTHAWTRQTATTFLSKRTLYSQARISMELDAILNRPGFQLSAFAGMTKFKDLQKRCIRECEEGFLTRLVEIGPMPFVLLEERLFTEQFIQ